MESYMGYIRSPNIYWQKGLVWKLEADSDKKVDISNIRQQGHILKMQDTDTDKVTSGHKK